MSEIENILSKNILNENNKKVEEFISKLDSIEDLYSKKIFGKDIDSICKKNKYELHSHNKIKSIKNKYSGLMNKLYNC